MAGNIMHVMVVMEGSCVEVLCAGVVYLDICRFVIFWCHDVGGAGFVGIIL